jgi:hypothetical protein
LFVRDGGILFLSQKNEFSRAEEVLSPETGILVFLVLPYYDANEKKTFQYYQDDGETSKEGEFNLIEFSVRKIE